MGIKLNGTFEGNCGFSITVLISIVLSILLFLILSYADAKDFSKTSGTVSVISKRCIPITNNRNRKNNANIPEP